MEEVKNAVRVSIWQVYQDLTFDYLRPKIKVEKNQLLFLQDINDRIYVFKTEDGTTVILPDSVIIRGQVQQVF